MNPAQKKMFVVLFLGTVLTACISCTSAQIFPSPLPDIQGCWKAVLDTEGCVQEILTSFLTLKIGLGPKCCKAIEDIGDNCFQSVFSGFPFNPSFPPLLRSFCASASPSLNQ